MRDLAKQHLNTRKRSTAISPRVTRLGLIVVGIVFLILVVNSALNLSGVGSGDGMVQNAPLGLTPVKVDGALVDVEGGIKLNSDKATFRNVGNIKATATAERVYGGGSFTMTVDATFIGTQGHKYQVWLTDGETMADAGFLEGVGTSWATTFRDSDRGYSGLDGIWITDELTKEDNKAETKILEGSF